MAMKRSEMPTNAQSGISNLHGFETQKIRRDSFVATKLCQSRTELRCMIVSVSWSVATGGGSQTQGGNDTHHACTRSHKSTGKRTVEDEPGPNGVLLGDGAGWGKSKVSEGEDAP